MKPEDVPPEWVESGAIELCWVGFHQALPGKTVKSYWRNVSPTAKQQYRKEVRAALAAVAPLIRRAALEEAAGVAETEGDWCPCGGPPCQTPPGHGCGIREANGESIAAAIRALDT